MPLPGDGSTITQLGHVNDLATAMALSIGVDAAANRIYNCSSVQGITFKGLVAAAARACGKDPAAVEIRSFDPSGLDKKSAQGVSASFGPLPHGCDPRATGAGLDAGLQR